MSDLKKTLKPGMEKLPLRDWIPYQAVRSQARDCSEASA